MWYWLSQLQNYSTEDSPEVTQEELWQFYDKMYNSNTNTMYDGSPIEQTYEILDRNTAHYTEEHSSNGENISVDELYDMTKNILRWTGYYN